MGVSFAAVRETAKINDIKWSYDQHAYSIWITNGPNVMNESNASNDKSRPSIGFRELENDN